MASHEQNASMLGTNLVSTLEDQPRSRGFPGGFLDQPF